MTPAVAGACLDSGAVLDEIWVNRVPVVLGDGIPFLAGITTASVRLEDLEVVEAAGGTHLRYREDGEHRASFFRRTGQSCPVDVRAWRWERCPSDRV